MANRAADHNLSQAPRHVSCDDPKSAYSTQFFAPHNDADNAMNRITARLCRAFTSRGSRTSRKIVSNPSISRPSKPENGATYSMGPTISAPYTDRILGMRACSMRRLRSRSLTWNEMRFTGRIPSERRERVMKRCLHIVTPRRTQQALERRGAEQRRSLLNDVLAKTVLGATARADQRPPINERRQKKVPSGWHHAPSRLTSGPLSSHNRT